MKIASSQARRVAAAMIADAQTRPALAMRHLEHLPADQWPALIAIILTAKRPAPIGKIEPLTMTRQERLRGHAQYVQGVRTPFTITAHREYQREHKRSAGRTPMSARLVAEDAMFTDAEARDAHAAYGRGDRTDRAVIGNRVYYRRIKAKRKAA